MDTLIYLTIAIGLLVVYFIFGRTKRGPLKGKVIPGPKGKPVIGYATELGKAPIHETFSKLAEQYGDIYQFTVFGKPFVILNSTETIRKAFTEEPASKFLNDRLETFFGKWLFFDSQAVAFQLRAHDSAHGELRKTLVRGLNQYGEGRGQLDITGAEVARVVERMGGLKGEAFDINDVMKRSLTNVVSIILSGDGIPDDANDVNVFWDFLSNALFLVRQDVDVLLRTFPMLRWLPGLYKGKCDIIETNMEVILKRFYHDMKATRKSGEIRGLVDFVLEEQQRALDEGREPLLTDDRVKATIMETIGGSTHTTLATMTTMFLCLIDHPECQTRIQEELDRVVGRGQAPTANHKAACVYTEAFTLECARYCPAANVGAFHFCRENIEFQGYDIPAGSLIVPNYWFTHHDEKVWGDPWAFRPERWLDDQGQLLPPDHAMRKSWLPFSVGRRSCAGEAVARSRMFLYVSAILQRFTLRLAPGQTPVSSDPRAGDYEITATISPKSYMCTAVPRDS